MKIYLYTYSHGKFTVKPIEVKETAKLYKMPYGNSYTQIKKEDIGVAKGWYYDVNMYLAERDDKRVRDLFFKYFENCISEAIEEKKIAERKIFCFAEKQDEMLKTEIKEKEKSNE